jgi:translation initiation factor 4E
MPSQGDNWNDLLKEVITFNSVEEFWGVYVGYPSTRNIPATNSPLE